MVKNANIKIPDLKKKLQTMEQKELIKIIADLYKLNGEVKDFLNVKFLGKEAAEDLFVRAYEAIEHEFFPANGFGEMRLAKAKKAISNYNKMTGDAIGKVDLMLGYVEYGTEFTNAYGDIDEGFYDSMLSMYDKVVEACEKDEALFRQFRDRLYDVVEESDGIGWGYHDGLKDIYYSIRWLEEE